MLKSNLSKSRFTLVEILIASAIMIPVVSSIIVVMLQMTEVNRDSAIDNLFIRSGRLIRTNLIKNYDLTQAEQRVINSVGGNSVFSFQIDDTKEWPGNEENPKVTYTMRLRNGYLQITNSGAALGETSLDPNSGGSGSNDLQVDSGDNEPRVRILNEMGVLIDKFQVDFLAGSSIDCVPNRLQFRMLMRVDSGKRSYFKEEILTVVVTNAN